MALKFLKPSPSENSSGKDKLLVEGRILEHLIRHPHIVNIRDYGKDQHNRPYIVMDYIEGQTLQSKHPKGMPVELPIVIDYVTQIASALDYAHERGILHRDLKLNNIMINTEQRIILLDFGLSIDEKNSLIELPGESAMGFPGTMAPERWDGKSQKESDVYSLGVIVFELLTGQKLFEGNQEELKRKHKEVMPRSLHELNSAIPEEINAVVLKALAKKPEHRYSSATKFAQALKTALATAQQKAVLHRQAAQQAIAVQALAAFTVALKEDAILKLIAQQNLSMRRNILIAILATFIASIVERIWFLMKPVLEIQKSVPLLERVRAPEPGTLLYTYSTPNQRFLSKEYGSSLIVYNRHVMMRATMKE